MKEFRLLYLIGDIQDKFILEAAQEQQDTRRGGFSKKIRYCALGLCAAMALCAGLVVYTQFQRTSDSLVGRPKVTTAVTDDVNSSGKVIQAIQNDMIEIIYQDDAGNELARIRKGLGTSEISGDYNLYENDSTQEIDGKSVHIRGNGRLVYAADWTDGVYAYSVTFESGAAEDTAEDVIMAVY